MRRNRPKTIDDLYKNNDVEREIRVDDGREMPEVEGISWTLKLVRAKACWPMRSTCLSPRRVQPFVKVNFVLSRYGNFTFHLSLNVPPV